MIAVIDYGVGNLFSLTSSLRAIGADAVVTGDAKVISGCDRIILPGVGAFGDAAEKLRASCLFDVVKAQAGEGKPLLGICLGMQLLFDKSYEYGEHEGLALIRGSVVAMKGAIPGELKIPHMGWNALRFPPDKPKSPLFSRINEGDFVYFVHSYYATGCQDSLIADTDYGLYLTAAVQSGNIFGTQFHPEKSGAVGLNILRAFCEFNSDTKRF